MFLPAGDDGVDVGALTAWLADAVDPGISSATVTRLPGGHSSGAWKVDVLAAGAWRAMVLKASADPSVVFRNDACREARVLDALGRMGAPVPHLLAIDDGEVTGGPCFVMEHVEGASLADTSLAGFHDDAWLRDSAPGTQRAVWDSFHDTLAALHAVDPAKVPDASHGPGGLVGVLEYWRDALLDVAAADGVPRQLAALDWLSANLPPGANADPAVCMGDARVVNCLIVGTDARTLVDFEAAYVGNPAADIGYSVFVEEQQRRNTQRPLPGIPAPDETWARWEQRTGRDVEHRDYWTAFGATIITITATRAMVQWGLSGVSAESDNPLVTTWEKTIERARLR